MVKLFQQLGALHFMLCGLAAMIDLQVNNCINLLQGNADRCREKHNAQFCRSQFLYTNFSFFSLLLCNPHEVLQNLGGPYTGYERQAVDLAQDLCSSLF
jgi:hypothetical protein